MFRRNNKKYNGLDWREKLWNTHDDVLRLGIKQEEYAKTLSRHEESWVGAVKEIKNEIKEIECPRGSDINGIINKKKWTKDIWGTIGKVIAIICVIAGCVFGGMRLAKSEVGLLQNLQQLGDSTALRECQNYCCIKLVEVIAEEKDIYEITFHSRTCQILHNFASGNIVIVYDKPLYLAGLPLGSIAENCDVCRLETIESYPCEAFCCLNYSYIEDMSTFPPVLHRLSCYELNTISGYHIFFVDRWSSSFSKLEKCTQLCKSCFKDYYKKGELM